MAETEQTPQPWSWRVTALRLATGVAQGEWLYILSDAARNKTWPADRPALFCALFLIAAFVPFIGLGGYGRIRPFVLLGWAVVATAVLALFGWHDIDAGVWEQSADRLFPAFPVVLFSGVFVFIGHHLVGPADAARRLRAPYPAYFDWAWKDAVQIVLSLAFLAVFWAGLELGAQMFKLIGVHVLADLIGKDWVSLPVSGLVFAAGVQLTDVRIGLIRGVRTIGLTLMSWLLPLMTVIAAAFLAALPFTGLSPLFGARSATATLLAVAAFLIVLVSAAYQDGQQDRRPAALRYAARVAAVALVPLVAIAAFALWLRIGQYGLSPARVTAAACTIVGVGYAIGYAASGLGRRGPWMRRVEATNIAMALVAMAVLVAIFTPIADPARLAVDSQVGRLSSGRIAPQRFDFGALQANDGRYGQQAFKALQASTIAAIAKAARASLANQGPPPPGVAIGQWTIYPAGTALPRSFVDQAWPAEFTPSVAPFGLSPFWSCLSTGDGCEAYVVDIDGDHEPDVLVSPPVVPPPAGEAPTMNLLIFKQAPDRVWRDIGWIEVRCSDAIAALRAGAVTLAPKTSVDLELAGRRQVVVAPDQAACPAAPSAPPKAALPKAVRAPSLPSHSGANKTP